MLSIVTTVYFARSILGIETENKPHASRKEENAEHVPRKERRISEDQRRHTITHDASKEHQRNQNDWNCDFHATAFTCPSRTTVDRSFVSVLCTNIFSSQ